MSRPTGRISFLSRRATRRWLALALCAAGISASHAASNTLTALDATATGDGAVNIRLTLANGAPTPSVFTVDEPARLSIDLPDTDLDVEQRYQRIEQGAVEAIALAAGGERTRVVVELTTMTDYTIDRQGNEITVGIAGAPSPRQAPITQTSVRSNTPVRTITDSDYQAQAASVRGPRVRDIDFRRGENGAGRIEIVLDGVNTAVDVNERDGQVIANLPGVALPDALERRLEVLDFATPVKTIDALARDGGTRIVVTPVSGADFEQVAYQTGDRFYIELQPLNASEKAEREEEQPRFVGERISLSFQNIDVRAVLQIIADVADVNMVVSDSVNGNMALRLEDVPWDQALDIIMQSKGLGMRRENNVIMIAPLVEITAREQAEAEAQEATTNLAPLRSEIIQINYAQAAAVASLLQSGKGELSLLSERGQIAVDKRTNTILVSETRENLTNIRGLINQIDIPVRQVLIESRIVVANRDFSRNLGVSSSAIDNAATKSLTDGNYLVDSGYTISLPASDATSALSTSIIGSTFALNLELSAMESENRGEIISSPRVITADGQEANIKQGREIPYQEGGTGDQPATIEFKEVVLGLTVIPKITPDERVIMTLDVTQDSVGQLVSTPTGGAVPSIDTRSLTTQVLVDDGETVVLGGVYEQRNLDQKDRVPLLGEIPLLGALFRGSQRQHDKRELLIFVTPKILKETFSLGH